MKTLFLTDGGEHVGFGHIARCISLSQVLRKNNSEIFFIINGDNSVKSIFDGECYRIFDWKKNKEQALSLIKDFDLVVIDSYQIDDDFCKELMDIPQYFICMQVDKAIHYPQGVVVKESLYTQGLQYLLKEGSIYLHGSRYAMLRDAFIDVLEKEIRENVDRVMVTVGGQDSQNLTPRIMEFLNQNYSRLKKDIIIGSRFDNVNEIEKIADQYTNLVYSPDAKNMKQLMCQADVAISAGGQTLYELARVGVPAIGICLVECQEKNVASWAESGFIINAGWHNNLDLSNKLGEALDKLMPYEERMKRSAIGRQYVDGKGAQRVIEKVLSLMN